MSQRYLAEVTGRSTGDHVCWPFHGMQDYVRVARDYVAEGLDRRELVAFVKATPRTLEHTIVSHVAQVGRPSDDRRPVLDAPTVLPTASPVGATTQIDRLTRAAAADGYTGLRLLTEVSDLVRGPDGRRGWMRSEHLIDRYALDHPLTALCGYDVDDVGEEVVAEAAYLHPLTHGAVTPFHVRARHADGGLALAGEVDATSAEDLYRAIMLIGPELPARVTVDLTELDFIDHSGLVALDRAARRLAVTVTLVEAQPLTAWLVDMLGLGDVEVSTAS